MLSYHLPLFGKKESEKLTDKRIVYSAVAIPGEPDSDGEILTPEEISHAAHAYLKDYRIVDPEHVCALGACKEVGIPVESYITDSEMSVKSYDGTTLDLPRGTWVIGIEVTDDKIYKQIQTGQKTGVSLTAKRADGVTKSRVLIRDLGPDWVARTVSIVQNPAVPKAKFFSKGIDNMTENDEVTKGFDRVIEAIKNIGKTEEEELVDAVKTEEEIEEPQEEVTYVTHEELEATKSEILEAIKTITAPQAEEVVDDVEETDAVKAEDQAEEEEEEDEKDKRIKELEAEIAELKAATKSKAIPDHFEQDNKAAIKNLYTDDGRDLYGRVIKD